MTENNPCSLGDLRELLNIIPDRDYEVRINVSPTFYATPKSVGVNHKKKCVYITLYESVENE